MVDKVRRGVIALGAVVGLSMLTLGLFPPVTHLAWENLEVASAYQQTNRMNGYVKRISKKPLAVVYDVGDMNVKRELSVPLLTIQNEDRTSHMLIKDDSKFDTSHPKKYEFLYASGIENMRSLLFHELGLRDAGRTVARDHFSSGSFGFDYGFFKGVDGYITSFKEI